MSLLISIIAILILTLLAVVIAMNQRLAYILIVIIPYAAFVIFLAGFIYRVVKWWTTPVPFRITTTCGQQKSLPWIKNNQVENPAGLPGVIMRMAQEIFLFRSLFQKYRCGYYRRQARLQQRQMAVVFRPSLSLVASDHCVEAPAIFCRTDCPLDQALFPHSTDSSRSASRHYI